MVLFLYFKNRKESEDMKKMEQLANVKAFLCMVFGAIAGVFVNLIVDQHIIICHFQKNK